jgi:hypothetical protein
MGGAPNTDAAGNSFGDVGFDGRYGARARWLMGLAAGGMSKGRLCCPC